MLDIWPKGGENTVGWSSKLHYKVALGVPIESVIIGWQLFRAVPNIGSQQMNGRLSPLRSSETRQVMHKQPVTEGEEVSWKHGWQSQRHLRRRNIWENYFLGATEKVGRRLGREMSHTSTEVSCSEHRLLVRSSDVKPARQFKAGTSK